MYQKYLADGVTSLKWELRRSDQFQARVKVYRNDFSQEISDHKHPLTQTKVEVVKVKAKIKRRIETSLDTDTPQQINTGNLEWISEANAVGTILYVASHMISSLVWGSSDEYDAVTNT